MKAAQPPPPLHTAAVAHSHTRTAHRWQRDGKGEGERGVGGTPAPRARTIIFLPSFSPTAMSSSAFLRMPPRASTSSWCENTLGRCLKPLQQGDSYTRKHKHVRTHARRPAGKRIRY